MDIASGATTPSDLHILDFGARHYDPIVPRWTTPDPLAEKYFPITPYAYCAGDPVNLVDPEGLEWYFYSKDGVSSPTWNWRNESEWHTGKYGIDGKEIVLKGTSAVVRFVGDRNEKLGEDGSINGEGAINATVIVYGPNGEDDIHVFTGYTMTSDADKFGPVDEGLYDGNYSIYSKSGKLTSHWVVNQGGKVRMMDGKVNPNAPKQFDYIINEGYKIGIWIHSTFENGRATGRTSTGCLLIHDKDWNRFNEVMSGVKKFKVSVERKVGEMYQLIKSWRKFWPIRYDAKLYKRYDVIKRD
ncbi:MAG: hypothetical protein IJ543_03090 [Bacteroidales bacterium]|nr:hypothetical protein [Bacteroidales bacterium]